MARTKKTTDKQPAYTVEPWSCVEASGKWQIEAYVTASGKREVVAEVVSKPVAEFIVQAVNNIAKNESLICEMESALEMCLEEGINWASEHDAESALRHAKGRTKL